MSNSNQKLVLFILHHIYLTREQRYVLGNGGNINTVGVTLPVWVNSRTGVTTEPATEIFCAYSFRNNPKQNGGIRFTKKGYTIYLPQLPEDYQPLLPPDDAALSAMTAPERREVLSNRAAWYQSNPIPPNPKQLLDFPEGGNGGYLSFDIKMKAKTIHETNPLQMTISHTIVINPLELLEKSLTQ